MSFPVSTVIKQKLVLFQVDVCYCGNRLVFSFDFFFKLIHRKQIGL